MMTREYCYFWLMFVVYQNKNHNKTRLIFFYLSRYVIVENLRFMLSAYKPTDPIYLGCRFKPFVKQGYMSGGAGILNSHFTN